MALVDGNVLRTDLERTKSVGVRLTGPGKSYQVLAVWGLGGDGELDAVILPGTYANCQQRKLVTM